MSDINEEQKRLYKRAKENDIKLLQEENERLNNIINEAIEYVENDIRYYNGKDIEKAFYLYIHKDSVHDLLNILKGDNK